MAITPARWAAYNILLRVERDAAYAGELLNAPSQEKLSPADRALTHELVLRTLRWQLSLDARIARHCKTKLAKLDREVLVALRLAACQLFYLERIPAHAAVDESVELVKKSGKRSAAPLANAVLRKLAAEATEPAAAAEHVADAAHLAAEFAHPAWLAARWIDMYGYLAARLICESNQLPAPTALRITAPGFPASSVESELTSNAIELAPGALLTSARRLLKGDLTHTEAFREHRVAIQDEASQLVAALVGRGEKILDCCAAPGGKTAAIAARNPQAKIVALELHEHRVRLLRQRVMAPNVEVVQADATQMTYAAEFDRVLADVPCSGTGTLSAHPEIKLRLTPEGLAGLKDLQISILKTAARALASGGRLVYSTCSLEAEEGEQVVEAVLRESPILKLLDCREVLEDLCAAGELVAPVESLLRGPYLRTLPGVHLCDGFFAAVLTHA